MKTLLLTGLSLVFLQTAPCKETVVAGAFGISLPGLEKEKINDPLPGGIFRPEHYYGDSFQLHIYQWPETKPAVPLKEIPALWAAGKAWTSVSHISVSKTDSGVPCVTFDARILKEGRPPFDSVMTVLRSPEGVTFLFQMTGTPETLHAIRQSIRYK